MARTINQLEDMVDSLRRICPRISRVINHKIGELTSNQVLSSVIWESQTPYMIHVVIIQREKSLNKIVPRRRRGNTYFSSFKIFTHSQKFKFTGFTVIFNGQYGPLSMLTMHTLGYKLHLFANIQLTWRLVTFRPKLPKFLNIITHWKVMCFQIWKRNHRSC